MRRKEKEASKVKQTTRHESRKNSSPHKCTCTLSPSPSYIVSRLPYFTWLLLVVTLSVIGVQINELRTEFRNTENRTDFSSDGAFKVEPSYIWVADLIFILFTLVDLSLKVDSPLSLSALLL